MDRILSFTYPLAIPDDQFSIVGSGDATKRIIFEVDAQTTGDTLTFDTGAQTDSRTLTAPVLTANATLAVLSEAQTFTGAKTFSSTVTLSAKTASRIVATGASQDLDTPAAVASDQSLSLTNASGIQTQQAATQDAIRLLGRAGGTGSYIATLTPTTLTASRTYTLPDADLTITGGGTISLGGYTLTIPATGTAALLAADNAFTGANTFVNAAGVITRQGSGQDGVTVLGRAGGASSYSNTLTTATLAANVTCTLPATTTTLAGLAVAQTFSGLNTFSAATTTFTLDVVLTAGALGFGAATLSSGQASFYTNGNTAFFGPFGNPSGNECGFSIPGQVGYKFSTTTLAHTFANGTVTISDTTDATSSTAAAIVGSGGLAIAKGQYVGTFLVIGTTLTVNGTSVTLADACNLVLNTTTGTKIGTATGQKIGFWNATPIIQPANANQAALTNSTGGTYDGTLAAISGTGDDAGINNNFTDIFTLLNEMRSVMVNTGLMKGAA